MTTAEKIKELCLSKKISLWYIASELKIDVFGLFEKLDSNTFTPGDLIILKKLGCNLD
jgi:hypothetical protein